MSVVSSESTIRIGSTSSACFIASSTDSTGLTLPFGTNFQIPSLKGTIVNFCSKFF